MTVYVVTGTKNGRTISEQVFSLVKAEWKMAQYRAEGYAVTITPLTSGSKQDTFQ